MELITTLNGFYSDEEVKDAKDLLSGTLDQMSPKPDGIPRFRPRMESANRRRLDCGDIVNLFEFADKNKVSLTKFCAINLHIGLMITYTMLSVQHHAVVAVSGCGYTLAEMFRVLERC